MERSSLPGLGEVGSVSVKAPSASAQVAAILRSEIQRGDHQPGSRLRQRDVAERLGVSTTPVREAFQVLQAEGFLVVENHRGAIVTRPSASEVQEGYAIRIALESLAMRRAAAAFDQHSRTSLEQLLERMSRAAAKDKWAALDNEFHHRLNEMAEMPKLLDLIDQLRSGVAVYVESAFEDPDQRRRADREHVAILEACASGDADLAASLIGEHLEHAADVIVGAMTDGT